MVRINLPRPKIVAGPSAPSAPLSKAFLSDRLAVCRECEYAVKRKAGILQCSQCGCVCQFKAALPAASCPLNKW